MPQEKPTNTEEEDAEWLRTLTKAVFLSYRFSQGESDVQEPYLALIVKEIRKKFPETAESKRVVEEIIYALTPQLEKFIGSSKHTPQNKERDPVKTELDTLGEIFDKYIETPRPIDLNFYKNFLIDFLRRDLAWVMGGRPDESLSRDPHFSYTKTYIVDGKLTLVKIIDVAHKRLRTLLLALQNSDSEVEANIRVLMHQYNILHPEDKFVLPPQDPPPPLL